MVALNKTSFLCFLFLSNCVCLVSTWDCGSGPISSNIAWALTFNSDRTKINECCKTHDEHYDNYTGGWSSISYNEADWIFEMCLSAICKKGIDYWVVRPVFTLAVDLNGWFRTHMPFFYD